MVADGAVLAACDGAAAGAACGAPKSGGSVRTFVSFPVLIFSDWSFMFGATLSMAFFMTSAGCAFESTEIGVPTAAPLVDVIPVTALEVGEKLLLGAVETGWTVDPGGE